MTKYDIILDKKKVITPEYDINYYNVRNNAWQFLIKNNVKSYPLNLRDIAINNNWQIFSYQKYCKIYNISEDELINQYPDGFTQIINDTTTICYNQNNNAWRNRFTIAHEFGHIILHNTYKDKKLEKEANMFASRILMPMILIKELNISTAEELSKLCNVSIESATFRIKRFYEIKGREKFYTNPLEIKLKNQLQDFINNTKE